MKIIYHFKNFSFLHIYLICKYLHTTYIILISVPLHQIVLFQKKKHRFAQFITFSIINIFYIRFL